MDMRSEMKNMFTLDQYRQVRLFENLFNHKFGVIAEECAVRLVGRASLILDTEMTNVLQDTNFYEFGNRTMFFSFSFQKNAHTYVHR